MPVAYREAQLADAPSLVRLILELGFEAPDDVVRRRLDRVLSSTDHIVYVAMERPHGVAGFVHAATRVTLGERPYCAIEAICVSSAHRRNGLGRGLLERAQGWAIRRGLDDVVIEAGRHRKVAHAFFGRMGYTMVGEHRIYRRDLAGVAQYADPSTAQD